MKAPSLTLGIEEEYQTIDPETRDLRSHIDTEIIQKGKMLLYESVKAEMHQSVVEVGTGVCENIHVAQRELTALRQQIMMKVMPPLVRLAEKATEAEPHPRLVTEADQ